MVPNVLMESKQVSEIDPIFFLVQLGHGVPKTDEFNILKIYDFPIENRQDERISSSAHKDYIRAHKTLPRTSRYSDFHFLLYMMVKFDPDTIMGIGKQISEDIPIDEACCELIESI